MRRWKLVTRLSPRINHPGVLVNRSAGLDELLEAERSDPLHSELLFCPNFFSFLFQFSQTLIIMSSAEQKPEIMWIYDAQKYSLLIAFEASKVFLMKAEKHFTNESPSFS